MPHYNLTKLAEEQQQSSAIPAAAIGALGASASVYPVLGNYALQKAEANKYNQILQKAREAHDADIGPELKEKMALKKHFLDNPPILFMRNDDIDNPEFIEARKAKNAKELADYESTAKAEIVANRKKVLDSATKSHVESMKNLQKDRSLLNKSAITRAGIGAGIGMGAYGAYRAYQRSKNPDQQSNAVDSASLGAGTAALGASVGALHADKMVQKADKAYEPVNDLKMKLNKLIKKRELYRNYDRIKFSDYQKQIDDVSSKLTHLEPPVEHARDLAYKRKGTLPLIGAGVGLGTYGAYKAYQHFKNKNKDN